MTSPGKWAWWRDGDLLIVGWMSVEQFGDKDVPICSVHDVRDAGRVVTTLEDAEAEPIA